MRGGKTAVKQAAVEPGEPVPGGLIQMACGLHARECLQQLQPILGGVVQIPGDRDGRDARKLLPQILLHGLSQPHMGVILSGQDHQ